LLYAHAVHCLAEAACRLSDRKPRSYPGARGWDACVLLATGLYLIGLRLLNDLARAGGAVTVTDHLGWLGDRPVPVRPAMVQRQRGRTRP